MELRSVEELMDLLYACRGVRGAPERGGPGVDLHDHALQTAALLRRGRPADKELQLTGLVHAIGHLLCPTDPTGRAERAADAVRPLLGARVARLLALHPWLDAPAADEDLLSLRQADEDGRVVGVDAGVLEDWRTVLELVAARNSRLGAVD
ncbi:Myo-inositol oxygenase [Streptomyces sp. yr375]|uniref:inositol oxygenase family protein n=1 Tax=Streptomyces sp. yr375 TaxID=1761906 RepID=UPI0008D7944E|nr:inositol oxygenase family protein [Streptomyces sp. yr375]SEP64994.1 Myo-inositol oxygenase [Streptomyces sp. yr375]